jgi:hypothetical protein
LVICPTAVQLLAEGHATPHSCALDERGRLRGVWIFQVLPFQCSARVCEISVAALRSKPTATQFVDDWQEIPLSSGDVAPAGLGVAWMTHVIAALAGPAAHSAQAAAAAKTVMLRRMIDVSVSSAVALLRSHQLSHITR